MSGAQFDDIIGSTDEETLEAELMDLLEEEDEVIEPNEKDSKNTPQINGTSDKNPVSLPSNGVKKVHSPPATITNVIDDLLEDRLNKLRLGNTFNISIDSNGNGQIKSVDDNATKMAQSAGTR